MDRAINEIHGILLSRGFGRAELEIEVDTPGEPNGVAFYGPVNLKRLARLNSEIRKPLRVILRHPFAVAGQIAAIFKVGNYKQAPSTMSAHIRADPISEEGEIETGPFEPERPEIVNKAVYALERRLQEAAGEQLR